MKYSEGIARSATYNHVIGRLIQAELYAERKGRGVWKQTSFCEKMALTDDTMGNRHRTKQLGFPGETAWPADTSRDDIRRRDLDPHSLIRDHDSHVTSDREPLADVVRNLQRSMMEMTEQLGQVIQHRCIADGTSTTVDSSDTPQTTRLPTTFPPPPMTTIFPAHARPYVNNLVSVMEELERSTGVSLRAAMAEAYRWRRCSTTGVASESLLEVETFSATLKTAILDGKDVNLASWLIPHFDLGEYSHYTGSDGSHHLLRPLSSDPRLHRNVTLAEFISTFNKYRNVMCEVWDRRRELDASETRIEGTAFYEYHKVFAARSAALILQHNVKLDWGGPRQWAILNVIQVF